MVSFYNLSLFKNLPFSYHWLVRRAISEGIRTVLDLGCGGGDFMKNISRGEGWEITGVDLYQDAVERARRGGVYQRVVRADVRRLPRLIGGRKYDLVFSSQTLEHLEKDEGEKALKSWEKLARKRIVISTPVGFIKYEPIGFKGIEENPFQKHRSGWTPEELKKKGYQVRGQGLRFVYGEGGLAKKFVFLLPVLSMISYLFSPLVYFLPKIGTCLIASKDKQGKEEGNRNHFCRN